VRPRPVDQIREGLLDDRVGAVVGLGLRRLEGAVGEHRIRAVARQEPTSAVLVAAHRARCEAPLDTQIAAIGIERPVQQALRHVRTPGGTPATSPR
jgi:hypothetical protein